jgi:hypothetical protein
MQEREDGLNPLEDTVALKKTNTDKKKTGCCR